MIQLYLPPLWLNPITSYAAASSASPSSLLQSSKSASRERKSRKWFDGIPWKIKCLQECMLAGGRRRRRRCNSNRISKYFRYSSYLRHALMECDPGIRLWTRGQRENKCTTKVRDKEKKKWLVHCKRLSWFHSERISGYWKSSKSHLNGRSRELRLDCELLFNAVSWLFLTSSFISSLD